MKRVKERIFEIIQTANDGDVPSRIFDIGIISLIILNVVLVIADTFNLPPAVSSAFNVIEVISVIIFTIEYLCRLWTSDLLYPEANPTKARIKYIFSFMALIDLFAILPFYIPFIIKIDLRVLRMLRIVRLFRVFKINRYTTALSAIGTVFKEKKNQLISSIFVVFLLMIIASVLMYNVEHDAQSEAFSNAFSALWWAVATFTTVGYGDIYPVTVMGKILSAVIAILGIGLVAVPTGIISAGFIENIDHSDSDDEKQYCPYCGKKIK
jgi:voltage-gated potassium channel